MDVDDAIGEGAEEFAFEDAHEAGEDDEVDLFFLEDSDEAFLGIFIEFGAKFSGRDVEGFEGMGFGEGKDAGVLDVGDDKDDFHGGAGAGAVAGEGIEVGPFAGAEDSDFDFAYHRHGICVT